MMVMFYIVFAVVIGLFIFTVAKGIGEWSRNNNSPRLTVDATVTSKRISVTHDQTANAGDITGAHGYTAHTHTSYFATFQVESGDRMELQVSGTEYGELREGDCGRLSFQGSRYLGFERTEN